jgi:hypothetical protein
MIPINVFLLISFLFFSFFNILLCYSTKNLLIENNRRKIKCFLIKTIRQKQAALALKPSDNESED